MCAGKLWWVFDKALSVACRYRCFVYPSHVMTREEAPVTQMSSDPGGERTAASRPPPLKYTQAAAAGSLIGPSIVIKGELTAAEDLLIMGRVEGIVDHDQTLTVHADGVVCGEVKAKNILVEGSVQGNLYAMERVRIDATGRMLSLIHI